MQTCFVVQGFGKKTDYSDGRVLDLDASYAVIKEAVEAAGLKCVRADEIQHSGTIDVPMYQQLLRADLVVADLSTSNVNAAFELGVRYGLRVPGNDLVSTYEATRAEGFGKEVQRRILIGTYVLSAGYYDAYYLRAQKVRRFILKDFEDAWEKVHVVLTPTTPSPAFAQGEKSGDPLQMYLSDIFTISCNLAGICGISVPCGFTRSPKLKLSCPWE